MTRRQGHLGQVLDVPCAHDHPAIIGVVPDRLDHILQLIINVLDYCRFTGKNLVQRVPLNGITDNVVNRLM